MNGLGKITERIHSDTQNQINAILAESEKEGGEISVKYDGIQKEEYWKIVNQSAKDAAARVDRIASAADMDTKKQTLALKQEMVALAFDRAIEMLAALPEEEYIELLAGFAEKGAQTGTEQLIFSPSDRSRCGKRVCIRANRLLTDAGRKGDLTMSEQTRPISGGLIVTDGRIDANYSLETLVGSYKDRLGSQVSKILFD